MLLYNSCCIFNLKPSLKVSVHETFDSGVSVSLYIVTETHRLSNLSHNGVADWLTALDLKSEGK